MIKIRELYDLSHTLARDYLSGFTYPWEALKGIKEFILTLGPTLDKSLSRGITDLGENLRV